MDSNSISSSDDSMKYLQSILDNDHVGGSKRLSRKEKAKKEEEEERERQRLAWEKQKADNKSKSKSTTLPVDNKKSSFKSTALQVAKDKKIEDRSKLALSRLAKQQSDKKEKLSSKLAQGKDKKSENKAKAKAKSALSRLTNLGDQPNRLDHHTQEAIVELSNKPPTLRVPVRVIDGVVVPVSEDILEICREFGITSQEYDELKGASCLEIKRKYPDRVLPQYLKLYRNLKTVDHKGLEDRHLSRTTRPDTTKGKVLKMLTTYQTSNKLKYFGIMRRYKSDSNFKQMIDEHRYDNPGIQLFIHDTNRAPPLD